MEWTTPSKQVAAGWSVGHGTNAETQHCVLVQVLGGGVLTSPGDAEAMATALLIHAKLAREFEAARSSESPDAA